MAPKDKKPVAPTLTRPAVTAAASLLYIPADVLEGFQERIETDIAWNLIEQASRRQKHSASKATVKQIFFSEAYQNKINNSIFGRFLNEESGLTMHDQWELLVPITMWDNERWANKEGKICFRNKNFITDNMLDMIKKAVAHDDISILKTELKLVNTLRVTDCKMTHLDKYLLSFEKLIILNICGNYLEDLDATMIPPTVKSIELQANMIRTVENFAKDLSSELLYIGLARNLITNESLNGIAFLPYSLTVLDLADNDICDLGQVLQALANFPNLFSLQLAGNPCAVCAAYARTVITKLPRLRWLDAREILLTDRPVQPFEPHPNDLQSAYFQFNAFRIMSAPRIPKLEKGTTATFHVELEIPLLDSVRRRFLMFRQNESLIEILPPPEDEEEWPMPSPLVSIIDSKEVVAEEPSIHESDIYKNPIRVNPREVHNFTVFESNRVQWNKIMNFQEPTIRIFSPDLVALRNTFRTIITIRVVYTFSVAKPKTDKKTADSKNDESRVVLATIKCALKRPDWSQASQHFHWDDSLATNEAVHWGDGDLSILQYGVLASKPAKPGGKQETDGNSTKQNIPDNLTCHFGFGIETK